MAKIIEERGEVKSNKENWAFDRVSPQFQIRPCRLAVSQSLLCNLRALLPKSLLAREAPRFFELRATGILGGMRRVTLTGIVLTCWDCAAQCMLKRFTMARTMADEQTLRFLMVKIRGSSCSMRFRRRGVLRQAKKTAP